MLKVETTHTTPSLPFEPLPELGSTPEEVHQTITKLIEKGETFELESEVDMPLRFEPGTIRLLVVR